MLLTRWIGVFLALLGVLGWWLLAGPVRTAGVQAPQKQGTALGNEETDWLDDASQELASVGWALTLRK